jgi:hypothetical protein
VHETGSCVPSGGGDSWWRSAAIYQLYVRSFADGNGDGVGDLAGVRSCLAYLADLGVDAIWFNPWYPSPMSDAGYDISDYRGIEPAFGTLADADALISEAHAMGIRIIIDVVPNHASDQHPWFTAALAAGPGSAERDRFWFRPGRGPSGDEPPNNWQSIFGGPAWTRVTEPDGSPGEWYLHLFAPQQPDYNWSNADVRREFEDVLRFWFGRGVDGIRIDSGALLTKDPLLPDVALDELPGPGHPFTDRDDVHDVYRSWRAVADEYPERVLIGEIWLPSVANAFNIFLLKRFFDSIPTDYIDAAAVDGASRLMILWRIVLPMSRPIIGVVSIFATVAVWKDFLWPLLVEYGYSPTREGLNVGIWQATYGTPENLIIAASAMAAIPTIVFFLIFQRNIMAGLTAGGIRG